MVTWIKLLPLLLIVYVHIPSTNGRPYRHSPMEQGGKDKGYVFINLNGRGHQVTSTASWSDESAADWQSNSMDSFYSDMSWESPSYENDDYELQDYRKYRRPKHVPKRRKYHEKMAKKPHDKPREISEEAEERSSDEASCDNAPPIDCSCAEKTPSEDCGCSEEDSASKDAFYLESVSGEEMSASSSELHCSCYEKTTSKCGENVIECSCSENHSSDEDSSWSDADFSCSCND